VAGLVTPEGPTLEQPGPEGLHPMEGTHTGAVCEELQPMGRTHVGEVCGELSPVRGTSRWSRGRVWGAFALKRKERQRQCVIN